MSKGWVSIHREIQDHWLWQEKREFSKLEAWLDILLNVNHTEQKVMIKSTLFTVKRGQSIKSLDTWANRWNWNKSKVRRFFVLLQKDKMIVTKNEHKTTRLTVCKYDSYQDLRNADETQMKHKRNADETQTTPNNNDNNINNENNENKNDVVENLDILFNRYVSSERIIEAVLKNEKNKFSNKDDIVNRLKDFTDTLKQDGIFEKTFTDYCSHFRRWHLKAPKSIIVNLTDTSNQIEVKKVTGRTNQV